MSRGRRVGLLGGTFDPIHVGHLAAAAAARRALDLDEVLLLTAHVPPHRPQPFASVHHRFAMVALAALTDESFRASDLELTQPGPSYTAMTLERLHAAGFGASQLFFITGADAFADIATWRDYPRFFDAAHFVVINRAGRVASSVRTVLPGLAARMVEVDPDGDPDVEADAVPRVFLVNRETPDVSSTTIRRRMAADLPVDGLVPPLVALHMRRHGLYEAGVSHDSADGRQSSANLLHE